MKYYYSAGTISLVAHIALELSNIEYQSIKVNLNQKEQRSPEFLAINPLGRVPALVTPQGVITETIAILNYITAVTAKPSVVASDYDQKSLFLSAQTDSFNSFLASTVHVAHAHLWRPERWVDSEAAKRDMAEKVPNNMLEYFKLIDDRWFQGPWVHGKTLTSSDCYLFVVSGWLKGDGVDLGQFEKVSSHYQNMLAIAEVKALVEGLYR